MIRVPYGREMKLKEFLTANKIESFIPMQYKTVEMKGSKVRQLTPVIRNLIFVNSTYIGLNQHKIKVEQTTPFRYIMDCATNMPMIVSDQDMVHFISVSDTMDEQLIYLTNIESTFKMGDRVKVIGGIFEGVEGRVVRIKKDRRVMVHINNVVAVVISFINPLLLEKLKD